MLQTTSRLGLANESFISPPKKLALGLAKTFEKMFQNNSIYKIIKDFGSNLSISEV